MPREGPRIAQEGLPGAPGPPRARVKKPKNPYFLQGPTERPRALLSGRVYAARSHSILGGVGKGCTLARFGYLCHGYGDERAP